MRVRFLLIATLTAATCLTASAQEQGVSNRLKSLKATAECYRDVLRQTAGKRIPVKAATERLLAISKDHPEFAKEPPAAR